MPAKRFEWHQTVERHALETAVWSFYHLQPRWAFGYPCHGYGTGCSAARLPLVWGVTQVSRALVALDGSRGPVWAVNQVSRALVALDGTHGPWGSSSQAWLFSSKDEWPIPSQGAVGLGAPIQKRCQRVIQSHEAKRRCQIASFHANSLCSASIACK